MVKKLFFCPLQFVYIRTMVFIVYSGCKAVCLYSKKWEVGVRRKGKEEEIECIRFPRRGRHSH